MVIELESSQRAPMVSEASKDPAPATDDVATRLALAVAARRPSSSDVDFVRAAASIDTVAQQVGPIVSWAQDVPRLSDAEALRRGVTVARTRRLVGLPTGGTLVALRELTSVLDRDSAGAGRLHALAVEVALRVARTSATTQPTHPRAG